jgi:hypothetical protein
MPRNNQMEAATNAFAGNEEAHAAAVSIWERYIGPEGRLVYLSDGDTRSGVELALQEEHGLDSETAGLVAADALSKVTTNRKNGGQENE